MSRQEGVKTIISVQPVQANRLKAKYKQPRSREQKVKHIRNARTKHSNWQQEQKKKNKKGTRSSNYTRKTRLEKKEKTFNIKWDNNVSYQ